MPAAKSLIDAHVHFARVGGRPEDGFASERMLGGPVGGLIRCQLRASGLSGGALSRAYRERLERDIRESRFVRQAVMLALDGVYDSAGRIDFARTHLYVPNDAVLELARLSPLFLAGASVHPGRRDALDELERVATAGAALIKWLPNAQGFDPADVAWLPFYRRLAALGMPLLVHSGIEFAVHAGTRGVGDPARWRIALDEGVQVIAAHAGSTGLGIFDPYGARFVDMLERYPNLHGDSSALGLPGRVGTFGRIARAARLDRLTFGSDWPLPCFASSLLFAGKPGRVLRVCRERNPFDRYVAFFEAMGWDASSAVLERLLPSRARGPASLLTRAGEVKA